MRLLRLKEDDARFGHVAGDLFMVEDADYDGDKVVGVKIKIEKIGNSFYKSQMRSASLPHLRKVSEKKFNE